MPSNVESDQTGKIRPEVALECNLLGLGEMVVHARVKEIRPGEVRLSSSLAIPRDERVTVEFNSSRYNLTTTTEGVVVQARSNPTVNKHYATVQFSDLEKGAEIFGVIDKFQRRHEVERAKELVAEAEQMEAFKKWGPMMKTAREAKELDPSEPKAAILEIKARGELKKRHILLGIIVGSILIVAAAAAAIIIRNDQKIEESFSKAIAEAKQALKNNEHIRVYELLDTARTLKPESNRIKQILEKLIPRELAEEYVIPVEYKDPYGIPTRSGRDYLNNYPLEIRHKASGILLSLVPQGEFKMGSPVGEEERQEDEFQHQVTISKYFYMSKYEITVGQFRKFVDATGYKTEAEKGGGGFVWTSEALAVRKGANWQNSYFNQSEHRPVVLVSWNDVQEYIKWLNKDKKWFRLPTEAEWEHACRALSKSRYYWGNIIRFANNFSNLLDPAAVSVFTTWVADGNSDGHVYTCHVRQKVANDFGLFHMSGNVWEWCSDWYGASYYQSGPAKDPTGPLKGEAKVLRGGSWASPTRDGRSARRHSNPKGFRSNDVGFRIVASQ